MNSYKIYIVEDMGVTRAALANILERNGHTVVGSSATAEKAWLEIDELQPDLVLLDLNLKGNKSGLWLAKKIRSHLSLPFIFITAYGSNDILNKITDIKSDGYIMKPFNNSTLLANIQIAIANFDKNVTIKKEETVTKDYFIVKTKMGAQKIIVDEILYMQSEGNYVHLFIENKEHICRFKLEDLIAEINNSQIQKTHRRFAVNVSKLTRIDKKSVFINDLEIPISKTFLSQIELIFKTNS